jgi:PDZ domain-containing protein
VRALTPARLLGAALFLLAVVVLLLWLLPSKSYLLVPDVAHPVAPAIKVPNEHKETLGGIYFVDVFERRATLLERLFPGIESGSTLVPADRLGPPGQSDKQRRQADLREMSRSQRVASAVALRAAGYKARFQLLGVVVESVLKNVPATGKLRPGDHIVSVDGKRVGSVCGLQHALAALPTLRTVTLGLRRGTRAHSVVLRPKLEPGGRRVLGILASSDARIGKLPLDVKIDAGNVGGPSAGLAFSLGILEALGKDVDRGNRVAVTGTIEADGCVGDIGGVKQKTIGARRAHVDAFLVPAGENAREARRYAEGLRIIPVESFQQALRALATLPNKS